MISLKMNKMKKKSQYWGQNKKVINIKDQNDKKITIKVKMINIEGQFDLKPFSFSISQAISIICLNAHTKNQQSLK